MNPDTKTKISNKITKLLSQMSSLGSEFIISPVTAHVNYCDDKIGAMRRLGLWLVNNNKSVSLLFKNLT